MQFENGKCMKIGRSHFVMFILFAAMMSNIMVVICRDTHGLELVYGERQPGNLRAFISTNSIHFVVWLQCQNEGKQTRKKKKKKIMHQQNRQIDFWFGFFDILLCFHFISYLFAAMKRCQTDVGAPWDSKNFISVLFSSTSLQFNSLFNFISPL